MPLKVPITYLKDTKLNNPDVFVFLREWSVDALRFNMREDAFWFAKIIESLVNEQRESLLLEPQLLKEYQIIILRARWTALSLLTENEIVDLFEKSFGVVLFDPDFDAWTKLREKLITMLVYEERDVLKRKVVDALLRNEEIITQKPFVLGEKTTSTTVSNWLKDYIQFVSTGPLDKLKQAQYFTESKNLGALSEEERAGVMRLIHFYERCRLSSLTPQGIEETMPVAAEIEGTGGVPGVIREGRFEQDDPEFVREFKKQLEAVFPERALKSAVAKLKEKETSFEALLKSQKAINEATRLNLLPQSELLRECAESLIPASPAKVDILKAYVCLQTLANKNLLLRLLEEANPVREQFVEYLREEEGPEDIQAFKLSPTSPQSLARFLKFVLVRRMRMNESDAVQIAVRIGNILKKAGKPEYFDIAYYDMESKAFKWKM